MKAVLASGLDPDEALEQCSMGGPLSDMVDYIVSTYEKLPDPNVEPNINNY